MGSGSESLPPGEYLSLSRDASGVADFLEGLGLSFLAGGGVGDRELPELFRFSRRTGSGDLSESEEDLRRGVGDFFFWGEADRSSALLLLFDLLFDFLTGDSFLAGAGESSESDQLFFFSPSSSLIFFGEGDFLTRFLRFTGEVELSEDEEFFLARFGFFLRPRRLPSDEDPEEESEE